jgi:hypothetical protein
VDDPFDLEARRSAAPPEEPGEFDAAELTVTWGREHVQPVQFCGLDLGPFSMTVRVRAGETTQAAASRAFSALDVIAEAEYRRKLPQFLARVREAGLAARDTR